MKQKKSKKRRRTKIRQQNEQRGLTRSRTFRIWVKKRHEQEEINSFGGELNEESVLRREILTATSCDFTSQFLMNGELEESSLS